METTKPFVILDLDKPRKFRFTLNAIIEFEELTGINLLDSGGGSEAFTKPKILRTFLYLGLKTNEENADITEESAGDLLDLINFADLLAKVVSTEKNVPRAVIPKKRQKSGTGTQPSKQPADAGSSQKSSTS